MDRGPGGAGCLPERRNGSRSDRSAPVRAVRRAASAAEAFDQQASDPRVDGQAGHHAADLGNSAPLDAHRDDLEHQGRLDGRLLGALKPRKCEDVGFAPAPQLQHRSGQIDPVDFRLLESRAMDMRAFVP